MVATCTDRKVKEDIEGNLTVALATLLTGHIDLLWRKVIKGDCKLAASALTVRDCQCQEHATYQRVQSL